MKSGEKFLKHFDKHFSTEEIEQFTVYSYTHANQLAFDNINQMVYSWSQLQELALDEDEHQG